MKLVKQRQLQDVIDKRMLLADLQRQLDNEKEELSKLEATVIVALEQGSPTERGQLSGVVQERAGSRRPSWKDEFAKVAGPEAVERVVAETPPGPATKILVVARSGRVTKVA